MTIPQTGRSRAAPPERAPPASRSSPAMRLTRSGFGHEVGRGYRDKRVPPGLDKLGAPAHPERPLLIPTRCRAISAHIRQSMPYFGLRFQVKVLKFLKVFPSLLAAVGRTGGLRT